jgi:O-6-methylguanine DNA methyltransferase
VPDDPADLLRARRLRVTPQRRAILEAFTGEVDEHLSADEVLARAGAAIPEIGRGTVYAALAELTELGILASVGSSEPIRYELNAAAHDHFRCRLCRRLFDVTFSGRDRVKRSLRGYAVEAVRIRVDGVCAQCLDYQRGLRDGAALIIERSTLGAAALGELACTLHDSPLGRLGLAGSPLGVARIAFEDHADFAALAKRASSRRGPRAGREQLTAAAASLDRYFHGGGGPAVENALDRRIMSSAHAEALSATRQIPFGQVRSYERLGPPLAPYDVGQAMGSNPIALLAPCHRVACGSYRPETYVGGAARLRLLLELETASAPRAS